jgi:hypothetical protein
MSKTAMAAAFAAAGWETAPDRLRVMMREAIRQGGAGRPERVRDYFLAALAKANDATLVWQLFPVPAQTAAIGLLFDEVKAGMPRLEGVADLELPQGHATGAASLGEGSGLSMPQGRREDDPAGEGATSGVPQGRSLPAPSPAPSLLRHEARDRVARLSVLQTFRIAGRALAEVTGRDMRGWLKNHRRDCHFIGLLDQTVVIPDDVRVGAIVPPDVADHCFAVATTMSNS